MSNLNDLTKEELITYAQLLSESLNSFNAIIGDTPVSEQLSIALNRMAEKGHVHDNLVPYTEFNKLKKQVESLTNLVGDSSVSEQINMAINQNK